MAYSKLDTVKAKIIRGNTETGRQQEVRLTIHAMRRHASIYTEEELPWRGRKSEERVIKDGGEAKPSVYAGHEAPHGVAVAGGLHALLHTFLAPSPGLVTAATTVWPPHTETCPLDDKGDNSILTSFGEVLSSQREACDSINQ